MKNILFKKNFKWLIIICLLLISSLACSIKKQDNKIVVEEHYDEEFYQKMKQKFSDAYYNILVARNLTNTNPYYCDNSKEGQIEDEELIELGMIKKEDLKDIDNNSYCKAWGKHWKTDDCGVDYEVFLHCKQYTDKGYFKKFLNN